MSGSFIPLGKAGQKVVVDLDSRRPAARKVQQATVEEAAEAINAMMAERGRVSAEELRRHHAAQEMQAIQTHFDRLKRYASPNEAVDFVEAMLARVPGGKS